VHSAEQQQMTEIRPSAANAARSADRAPDAHSKGDAGTSYSSAAEYLEHGLA
jgi:hypothetical protein